MGCRSTLHIIHCCHFTGLLFLSVFISHFVSTRSIAVITHSNTSLATYHDAPSSAPPPPPRGSSESFRRVPGDLILSRNEETASTAHPVRWSDRTVAHTHPNPGPGRQRVRREQSAAAPLPPPALLQPAFERYVERVTNGSSRRTNNKNKTSPGPVSSAPKVVRYYRLHSRCSGRSVQVKGRHVNALATAEDSKYARLRVETDSFKSRVRIQSDVTKDYLCFSKNGRLTIKHSGKGDACLFHEVHAANHYTEFSSVLNPLWFIGFKKNGQRMVAEAAATTEVGDSQTPATRKPARTRHCYQFTKHEYNFVASDDVSGRTSGSGGNAGFPPVVDAPNGPLVPEVGSRYAEYIADRQLGAGA